MAVFRSIGGFYDPLRLLSALGDRSPVVLKQETEKNTSNPTLIQASP